MMLQLHAYRPNFTFREFILRANQEVKKPRYSEGVSIVLSMARKISLSNLNMRAVALHKLSRVKRSQSILLRNISIETDIVSED